MSITTFQRWFCIGLGALSLVMAGCKPHAKDHHDHAHGHAHSGHAARDEEKAGSHGHGEESPSGASFKEGQGVLMVEETRQSIGLQVADVLEKNIPSEIPITVQVFGQRHSPAHTAQDHTQCQMEASGFLDSQLAARLQPGMKVSLAEAGTQATHATVKEVHKALALGESEVVISITNAPPTFSPQSFHQATIEIPSSEMLPCIPASALLQTAEGPFVYTVNGDAYYRTAIKTAARSGGWIAVSDGLLSGDQVVTHPVQTLWLIELRATKGGGHCH